MPYFPSGSIRLYYEEKGLGTPLILLHGYSLDHRMWQDQAEYFACKYRVITYDARGHGLSEAPESDYAREDRAADLLNLLNYLKLERIHLGGLSMGGGDALNFAIDHQERLFSLILADTVASGYQPSTRFRDFAKDIRRKSVDEIKKEYIESTLSYYLKRDPRIKENLAIMMTAFSGRPWTDPKRGQYPRRDDVRLAARIRIPSLIMVGKKDMAWLPLAKILNEIMLDSRLEIMTGVGHMSNMEAPDRFNSLLDQFLVDVGKNLVRPAEKQ